MVARSEFRSDLYYRLNVFPIFLPALRERRADISALVTHFTKHSATHGKAGRLDFSGTMAAFQWYSWPGNIRELQNLVERAVILSRDGVLPNPLHKGERRLWLQSTSFPACPSSMTLEDSDRALIVETLERVRWIVGGPSGAAAKLGLKRTTLLAKMRGWDLRPIHQEETDVLALAPQAYDGTMLIP